MLALPDLTLLLSVAVAVLVVTPFLGRYMASVMEGQRTFLSPVLRPVERAVYRVCGVDESSEQGWKGYSVALLLFSLVGILVMYAMLRLQDVLPLNPNASAAFTPELAFNTSVSFETNTNWQNYSGEGASHLIQSAGLAVRNFTSAAAGIAIAVALIRGLVRRNASSIGNFWVDLTRSTLYILLPLAVVGAIVLAWQGVTQTFDGTATATTLQGVDQVIARGPFASQEIIKELGTNGGGPLNANSAHPFENPTGLTNWLEMFAILIIPFSLTYTFGRMAGDQRQGWAIFAAMAGVLVVGAVVAMAGETGGNPLFPAGVDQHLGSMEGKELRIGSGAGGLWAAVTTGTSTGAVNAMHDSFQPMAGLVPHLPHAARRDRAGRRGRRPLRHAHPGCHPLRLHRRAHGRPHARVPGQEGRGLRDEDGDAAWSSCWVPASWASPASPPRPPKGRPARSTAARTASARSSTPSPARRATTARPSPA